MKRFVQTIFLLLATTCCVVGQCYENHRQEGIAAYNHGDYKIAKKHFEYILSTCDDKPTTNDIQSWIDKCDAALKPTTTTPRTSNSTAGHNTGNKTTSSGSVNNRQNVTPYLYVSKTSISCSANGTTEYLSVNCNGNWSIQYTYASSNPMLYTATREDNKIKVYIAPNDYTTSRSDYFYVVCGDKKVKISLSQSGISEQKTNSPTIDNNTTNTSLYLYVSKTSIVCSASGTTDYLSVNCNGNWSIQYPSSSMYTATRNGNEITVRITTNDYTTSRSDFFNVVCGDKVVKVSLSQAGKTTSNRSAYHQSAYQRFINTNGSVAITWFGISGEIGTGATFTESLLRFRLGPIEWRPLDITGGYDFIYGTTYFAYQPILDFYIPTSSDKALYFGAGPSIGSGDREFWFRAEGGLHWEWGSYASSDFYLRYNGMYTVGVSIQWASKWR